jgi:hypothetical protein
MTDGWGEEAIVKRAGMTRIAGESDPGDFLNRFAGWSRIRKDTTGRNVPMA